VARSDDEDGGFEDAGADEEMDEDE
jgi:hypothetical protein